MSFLSFLDTYCGTAVSYTHLVDYMIKVAESYKMPLAMNLSFGNSYGSHDGTSLISTYLDSMADGRRVSICVGAGNEGDSACLLYTSL